MSEVAEPEHTTTRAAGPWARFLSYSIDLIVLQVVLMAVAVIAFPLTDGAVRMTIPALSEDCAPLETIPPGFDEAVRSVTSASEPAFNPNVIERCRMGVGPFDTHLYAYVAEERPGGLYFQRALTPGGAVTDPLMFLNDVSRLLLIVALVLMEWRLGTTIGKAALGLQVENRDGSPLSFRGAVLRNLTLWGLAALLSVIEVAVLWERPFDRYVQIFGDAGLATLLIGAWQIVLVIVWLISNGQPPWDRIAGSRVVRR